MKLILIQIILFQGLFLVFFILFLRKETFHTLNRWYLLLSSVLSIVLPNSNGLFLFSKAPERNLFALPEVVLQSQLFQLPEVILTAKESAFNFSGLYFVYSVGVVVSLSLFVRKAFQLFLLIKNNEKVVFQNYTLVKLGNADTAFSFGRFLFMGQSISQEKQYYILAHEQVHILQKHSIDLIWFEVLKVLLWFSPFSYSYQRKMIAQHEFIADAASVEQLHSKSYYNQLLNDIFQVENIAFVNQFYHKSLLKNRIIMLTKNKSANWKQLKYLAFFPIVVMMLLISIGVDAQEIAKESVAIQEPILDQSTAIGFGKVEQTPIFPGCESEKTNEAQKKCFSKSINTFVAQNFDINTTKNIGLTEGKHRIAIQFVINKKGGVSDYKVKAPHKELEKEAIRMIKSLPTMQPGKQKGKAVDVMFQLPIIFKIEEAEKAEKHHVMGEKAVSFRIIEDAPVFPGCENAGDRAAIKKCFSKSVSLFVSKNFDSSLANDLNLEPGKKRISVQFIVSAKGMIKGVKVKAPHKKLDKEVRRVINAMPLMKPALQKGKTVDVKFNLPIIFEVVGNPKVKK